VARAEAAALALLCIAGSGAAAGGLNLTAAERAAFGAEVRALLLDEPEIVERALLPAPADPFEGFSDEAAADTALLADLAEALVADPADWAEGPADGTPLVAFLPASCADCAGLLSDLRALAARQGARLVVKDLSDPETAALFLTAVLSEIGPEGWVLARAALADLSDPADPAELLRLAEAFEWDAEAIGTAMDSDETRERIDGVRALYDRLGFDMAPSYVAGGILVRGDVPPVVLERYLGE
jgi:hypothetical protein